MLTGMEKIEKKSMICVKVMETELLTSPGSGENVTLPCGCE